MESTVQLYNTALARLGGEQLPMNISALERNNTGRICENIFPHALDMALSAAPWAFAVRRRILASPVLKDTMSTPAYPLAYELPTDCVKPLRLEGTVCAGMASINRTPSYVIEGRTIRTTTENAVLVYITRIKDPKLWPALFADALSWAMAGELASAINNDPQKQQWCYQNYHIAVSNAVAVDNANQNPKPKQSEWTAARFGEGDY